MIRGGHPRPAAELPHRLGDSFVVRRHDDLGHLFSPGRRLPGVLDQRLAVGTAHQRLARETRGAVSRRNDHRRAHAHPLLFWYSATASS